MSPAQCQEKSTPKSGKAKKQNQKRKAETRKRGKAKMKSDNRESGKAVHGTPRTQNKEYDRLAENKKTGEWGRLPQ
jgi:hypothetical protein